jgi:hypothetical protein
MPRWEIIVIWCLRAVVLVTGAIFVHRGEWILGGFCVIAVLVAITPTVIVRTPNLTWPFEVEVALLGLLLVNLTLSGVVQLHTHIVWVLLGSSVVVGFVAFMTVYAAHVVRHHRPHPVLDGVAILLATLGLGALWAIGEFAVEQLSGRHGDGATLSPLVHKMWDLILDGFGGAIAAILGPLYIHRSKRCQQRTAQFAAHLDARNARPARCNACARPPDGQPWWTAR